MEREVISIARRDTDTKAKHKLGGSKEEYSLFHCRGQLLFKTTFNSNQTNTNTCFRK